MMTERELEFLETIEDLTRQLVYCRGDGMVDSNGLSAVADAMRLLALEGRMKICEDLSGDFVVGKFVV